MLKFDRITRDNFQTSGDICVCLARPSRRWQCLSDFWRLELDCCFATLKLCCVVGGPVTLFALCVFLLLFFCFLFLLFATAYRAPSPTLWLHCCHTVTQGCPSSPSSSPSIRYAVAPSLAAVRDTAQHCPVLHGYTVAVQDLHSLTACSAMLHGRLGACVQRRGPRAPYAPWTTWISNG